MEAHEGPRRHQRERLQGVEGELLSEGVPGGDMLRFYAGGSPTVEISNWCYRTP